MVLLYLYEDDETTDWVSLMPVQPKGLRSSPSSEGDISVMNSLVLLLGRLIQVLDDYAIVSSEDHPDGPRLLVSVRGGRKQFEFVDTPSRIVDHVLAFEHVPLWDPKVDTEDAGRWLSKRQTQTSACSFSLKAAFPLDERRDMPVATSQNCTNN